MKLIKIVSGHRHCVTNDRSFLFLHTALLFLSVSCSVLMFFIPIHFHVDHTVERYNCVISVTRCMQKIVYSLSVNRKLSVFCVYLVSHVCRSLAKEILAIIMLYRTWMRWKKF